ncbi:hypothetical protein LCGC14_1712810 [marine sediment metagenome]|uniref:Uncharacterized protein n=1 Tax=marine sediment metagenome TaxID=412755 RepID=A0A0F9HEC3_9ZZZZ
MANKNVVVTDPVADDVMIIQIRFDGAGAVTMLAGNVDVTTDEGSTTHAGSFNFDVSGLPAAAQTAITDLVAECLTRFKSEHGF